MVDGEDERSDSERSRRGVRGGRAKDGDDLAGRVIGDRYRVEAKIGAGGMGTVWRVQHVESLQRFALKTMHAKAATEKINVDRFLREVRAAAALKSRYVVQVVDAQMSYVDPERGEPMPFLVMELLRGSNLEQTIGYLGPLSAENVVWILQQVARALDLAHQKGIIHRDLKPENLFLAEDEESGERVVKVCDFGIAKLDREQAGTLVQQGALGTRTGTTIGTPLYMAPEQARNSATVVTATDQWPIALIAFRALTAKEYFASALSTADLLLRIVNDPLEPPSARSPTLPKAFDEWFMRSCRRDPKERWGSVGEQVEALKRALGVTEPAAPERVPSAAKMATAATVPVTSSGGSSKVALATPAGSVMIPKHSRATTWAVLAAAVLLGGGGAYLLTRAPRSAPDSTATSSAAPTAAPSNTMTATTTHASVITMSPIPQPLPAASTPPFAPSAPPSASSSAAPIHPPIVPAKPPIPPSIAPAKSTAASVAPVASTTTPFATPKGAAKGAPCEANSDCASLVCAAYTCQ